MESQFPNKEQIEKLTKWLRSKAGRKAILKANKHVEKMSRIFDGMVMTPEKWNKIKDIPYTI